MRQDQKAGGNNRASPYGDAQDMQQHERLGESEVPLIRRVARGGLCTRNQQQRKNEGPAQDRPVNSSGAESGNQQQDERGGSDVPQLALMRGGENVRDQNEISREATGSAHTRGRKPRANQLAEDHGGYAR
ncbi:MAG: hypothetical protein WBE37_00900 [Bryobacteraceae bacterium]